MQFTKEDKHALQHTKDSRQELEKMKIKTKTKYEYTSSRVSKYLAD